MKSPETHPPSDHFKNSRLTAFPGEVSLNDFKDWESKKIFHWPAPKGALNGSSAYVVWDMENVRWLPELQKSPGHNKYLPHDYILLLTRILIEDCGAKDVQFLVSISQTSLPSLPEYVRRNITEFNRESSVTLITPEGKNSKYKNQEADDALKSKCSFWIEKSSSPKDVLVLLTGDGDFNSLAHKARFDKNLLVFVISNQEEWGDTCKKNTHASMMNGDLIHWFQDWHRFLWYHYIGRFKEPQSIKPSPNIKPPAHRADSITQAAPVTPAIPAAPVVTNAWTGGLINPVSTLSSTPPTIPLPLTPTPSLSTQLSSRETVNARPTYDNDKFNHRMWTEYTSELKRSAHLDIVIMVGLTSSMMPYLQELARNFETEFSKIYDRYTETKNHLRYAIVIYRDVQDEKPIEFLDFTKNIGEVCKFLSELKEPASTKRADSAEDVAGGLLKVDELKFREPALYPAVLLHLCDAPAHNRTFHPKDNQLLCEFWNRQEIEPDQFEKSPPPGRGPAVDEAKKVLNSLKMKISKYFLFHFLINDTKNMADKFRELAGPLRNGEEFICDIDMEKAPKTAIAETLAISCVRTIALDINFKKDPNAPAIDKPSFVNGPQSQDLKAFSWHNDNTLHDILLQVGGWLPGDIIISNSSEVKANILNSFFDQGARAVNCTVSSMKPVSFTDIINICLGRQTNIEKITGNTRLMIFSNVSANHDICLPTLDTENNSLWFLKSLPNIDKYDRITVIASHLAEQFNSKIAAILEDLKKAKSKDQRLLLHLEPNTSKAITKAEVDKFGKLFQIVYQPAKIVQYETKGSEPNTKAIKATHVLMPYLPGKLTKIINNQGYVNSDIPISVNDACTTFAHWTYHITENRLLVADIQGFIDSARQRFLATEPVIHSVLQPGKFCNRGVDKGITGVVAFFSSHSCTTGCRALGLPNQKEELNRAVQTAQDKVLKDLLLK